MNIQKTFKNDKPTVYLIGTPIGNLDDISLRALDTLKHVSYIFCEDTRTSSTFLKKHKISKPLISLHKFNEKERIKSIEDILRIGKSIAIISDAGCPTISDPGALVVQELLAKDICNITSVNVGPAYMHAIVASGFVNNTNYFYGFIVNKSKTSKLNELKKILEHYTETIISFYESVHRIKDTINALSQLVESDSQILIARELTKINEEFIRGTVVEINEFIQSESFVEKGEFVIVLNNKKIVETTMSVEQILFNVNLLLQQGNKLKDACQVVSNQANLTKNEIYSIYIKNN
ncbi:16S rRNA (cytidine(1402)-2'-O)-methyltransferase [Mesoplasma corruscae]|uniref:16S rRNA (Cytidine1402-2'-O)-methyltransferase n=1 Tax=Mesoplasma corruscae TaxID=216874 RepID=A0A2S5RH86_9MOLU|nr:16S rRNA (cytidine(1402)-2'-O)-methyltransferase [Mesoplasma corruscae]PPE06582.1 16S rRNA (cytidine1402-2'-O)-methyltransferase [Mesoplasma corruscae]